MTKVEVRVNGRNIKLDKGTTLEHLIEKLELDAKNLAVELNGDFFKVKEAIDTELSEGDQVEIVRFVGGG